MTARPRSHPSTPSPDTIVIGGGIAGISAAVHLAEGGRRVVVIERTAIAAGASGRNSGVVQHPFDPVLVDLHLETVELYRRLVDEDGDGDFALPDRPTGLLSVTHDEDVARHEAAALAVSHPELEPTFLDAAEAQALESTLAPGVAACRLAIGYPVGPASATRAYARAAQRRGVEIRVGLAASPWLDGERVRGVRLADGTTIAAPTVVVAAGPWSPELVDPTGAWRPIRPLWGVVVAVALADPPSHVLEEAVSGIPIDSDGAHDDSHSFSLITAQGSSSLGSTFLEAEPDAAARVPGLVERGASFVPALAAAPVGAVRACARPLSLDGRPLVGAIPWLDGLWIVAGHGPWGISTGPASGRLVADLITRLQASPPADLDPARFSA
ncbi:FAD-binding oxidoreductase [soil metagenome]